MKLRRLRAAQRTVLGERPARPRRARRPAPGGVRRSCATGSRRRPRASSSGWPAPSAASTAASPTRSLVRYDAWGEMSGQQSSTIALLDAHRTGVVVSSILHRDQARVYVKQLREGESELELSPEEQQAIEAAMARRAARSHRARLSDARCASPSWVPPGPTPRRPCAPRRPRGRGGALPDDLRRRSWRCRTATVDRAVVPIENSLEGVGVDHARRACRSTPRTCASSPRSCTRSTTAWSRRASSPSTTSSAWSRTRRRPRSARASCASGWPAPSCSSAASTADAVLLGARRRRAVRRRSARGWPPSCTAAACSRTNVEDHPDNVTRFVWLARDGDAGAPPAGRQDVDRVLGRRRPVAGLARRRRSPSSPDRGVNLTRIESRPRRIAIGHYMFFADLEGGASDAARGRGARRRCAATSRCCAFSARTRFRAVHPAKLRRRWR